MTKICHCCGKPIKSATASDWHSSCIHRFFGGNKIPAISLDDIIQEELINNFIERGSSITGVQKKLSVDFPSSRKTVVTGERFIIKTSAKDKPFLPEYEFVGMKLAEIAGFKTVPNGLVRSSSGEWIYVTQRIDRKNEGSTTIKVPMEDFAQLSETQTEYKYNGSYERCAKKVIDRFSSTASLDKILFFKMVFFSYVIGNTDMHLKNFSLIKTEDGYSLSPFYDILPVLMVVNQNEMALTVNGKNKRLTKKDFLCFGESIGFSKGLSLSLIALILGKSEEMFSFIRESPLPQEKQEGLIALIQDRMAPFFGE